MVLTRHGRKIAVKGPLEKANSRCRKAQQTPNILRRNIDVPSWCSPSWRAAQVPRCGVMHGGMCAHMVHHDADFHEGPVALGQLGGRPVRVLARQELEVAHQPGVLWPRQVRQRTRPPVNAIHHPDPPQHTPMREEEPCMLGALTIPSCNFGRCTSAADLRSVLHLMVQTKSRTTNHNTYL